MEIIAYKGQSHVIEWYFDTHGNSPALQYYYDLSVNDKIKVLRLFKRMGDVGEIKDKTKFRHEGDKIYAFKPQPDRFLCFFCQENKIIVTNAFKKKQQKLPVREKNRAIKYKKDYTKRVKRGEYYD